MRIANPMTVAAMAIAMTAPASACVRAAVMDILSLVVVAGLDRGRSQNLVDAVAVLIGPLLDSVEHVAVDLAVLSAESRVVEDL